MLYMVCDWKPQYFQLFRIDICDSVEYGSVPREIIVIDKNVSITATAGYFFLLAFSSFQFWKPFL